MRGIPCKILGPDILEIELSEGHFCNVQKPVYESQSMAGRFQIRPRPPTICGFGFSLLVQISRQVYTYYNFGPLTAYLALNYLDRFLSRYELPEGKAWVTQLLSVACLSLAAKMEETYVPRSLDLQIGEELYVFEPKAIRGMELLVLSTLNWRMQAVTPFSYIEYFLGELNCGNATPRSWFVQSAELILCVARGTVCLGFRPSEIAAAVAAAVVRDVDDAGIAKACTHVDKERVLRCQEQLMPHHQSAMASSYSSTPSSPVGVLDASCRSCKSDDATTIAAHGSSCCCHDGSPVTSKRRKISR